MKFHFTVPNGQARARIDPLVRTLGREHRVRVTSADVSLKGEPATAGLVGALSDWGYELRSGEVLPKVEPDEVWMLGVPTEGMFSSGILSVAEDHMGKRRSGKVYLFQSDDEPSMNWNAIPEVLRLWSAKALRNHWPTTLSAHCHHSPVGWLPPMMRQEPARAGTDLKDRKLSCSFWGRPTNPDRDRIVDSLKALIEFRGTVRENPLWTTDQHSEVLLRSKICIAPRGAHPITFRFFEGLSRRCLVLASSLADTQFLHGGLKPGIHYVEITPESVVEKVEFYLSRPALSQAIANAGYDHYVKFLAPPQGTEFLSDWMIRSVVQSWGM